MSRPANPVTLPLSEYSPKHFLLEVDGKIASAFIRARRPEAKSCCGPTCCS